MLIIIHNITERPNIKN